MAVRALNLFAQPEQGQQQSFASEQDIARRRMMAKALAEAAAAQQVKHPLQGANVLAQSALSGLEDARASRDERTRSQAMAQALGGMTGGDLGPEAMATIFALDPQLGLSLQQQAYQREQAAKAEQIAAADRAQQQSNSDRSFGLQERQFEHEVGKPNLHNASPGTSVLDANNPAAGPVYTAPAAPAAAPTPADQAGVRKEVYSLPSYKAYSQVGPVFASMIDSFPRNTRAADMNMVYGIATLMDPGSVVREADQIMVSETASLPSQVVGMINSLNGGQALDAATRMSIMTEAAGRVKAYEAAYMADAEQYRGIALRNQWNEADILPTIAPLSVWPPPDAAGKQGDAVAPGVPAATGAPSPPAVTPEAAAGLPPDVTEEDIEFTMRKHGLTREQVLERLRGPANAP